MLDTDDDKKQHKNEVAAIADEHPQARTDARLNANEDERGSE